jgi:DNA-binding PadR family transcriptional regulator
MSLEHAILGFLQYESFSGYDLKKVFDTSIQHFWPADQSQIYRTLGQLAEEGLVEVEVVPQRDRPDRKVYSVTEAGRAELHRWLTGPTPLQEPRSAPLIQVFFAGLLSDEEALLIFRRGAEFIRMMLDSYGHVPPVIDKISTELATPRDAFFWALTLESGLVQARSQLAWMEDVIRRLENKEYVSPLFVAEGAPYGDDAE